MTPDQALAPIKARLDAATPERWKQWPENPDYEVSDHGNVRSWLARGRETGKPLTPRLLKPRRDPKRHYTSLSLRHKDGRTASRSIHAVVMQTWVGPRPAGMEIAHLNGVADDNRLVNLQYVTHVENESHKVGHGTKALGSTVNGAVLAEWQVAEIKYLAGKGISHGDIGRLFSIGHKAVSEIMSGRNWSHVDPRKDATDITRLLAAVEAVTALADVFAIESFHATACFPEKSDALADACDRIRAALSEALGGDGQ